MSTPNEETVEETITDPTEQEDTTSLEDGWGLDDDDPSTLEEQPEEEETPSADPAEEEDDDPATVDGDQEPKPAEGDEELSDDEKALLERAGADEPEVKPEVKPETKEDDPAPKAELPKVEGNIMDLLNAMAADPDGTEDITFRVGDTDVSLRDTIKEYGADFVAPAAGLAQIAVNQMVEKGELVSKAVVDELRTEIAAHNFWNRLTIIHGDAEKIAGSDEFKSWAEKQPKGVQSLLSTGNVDDADHVLKAYKAFVARTNKAGTDKGNAAELKRKADLHKGTIRPKATPSSKKTATDDMSRGWALADEDDD